MQQGRLTTEQEEPLIEAYTGRGVVTVAQPPAVTAEQREAGLRVIHRLISLNYLMYNPRGDYYVISNKGIKYVEAYRLAPSELIDASQEVRAALEKSRRDELGSAYSLSPETISELESRGIDQATISRVMTIEREQDEV